MSYQTYKEYMSRIRLAYNSATKKGKSDILDHVALVTDKDRKTLIRRMRLPDNQVIALPSWINHTKRGRPCLYPRDTFGPLIQDLWLTMGRLSARHLKAAFADWLPFYKAPTGLPLDPVIFKLLSEMSVATLERFIGYARSKYRATNGLSTTSRATRLLPQVPIVTLAEQRAEKPGYMQADTVAHCGTSAAGEFINSLTITDLKTAWTVNRALLGKKALAVREQFVEIVQTLPFQLWAVNTDSGSEFVNHPMIQFMNRPPGYEAGKVIAFTRSRAYKKNGRVEKWRIPGFESDMFPLPSRQTVHADFPHTAFIVNGIPSLLPGQRGWLPA